MNKIDTDKYWSISIDDIFKRLSSAADGLSDADAKQRLDKLAVGKGDHHDLHSLHLFIGQFKSPLILMLLFAAGLSFYLEDHADAIIIMGIVGVSGCLGFWQEWGAQDAVKKMLAIVQSKVSVIRGGITKEVSTNQVVPGDVIQLSAGATIPGDSLIIESKELFVDEAALTGETFPAEKHAGVIAEDLNLSARSNSLFKGTHVISGTAKALVVSTGIDTEFGKVSNRLSIKPPETDFEHGIRMFGYMLVQITLVLTLTIFAINVFMHKQILDSFMFSLALSVGLTPQLLPAIISVNLASGARHMAESRVIVKRLAAIESFGSMNVLCSDKTGTITEGIVELKDVVDINNQPSPQAKLFAYLNATMETGFVNPIDEALRQLKLPEAESYKKSDEVPYDFIRKRLTVLVEKDNKQLMLTKGALKNILDVCTKAQVGDNKFAEIEEVRAKILDLMQQYSNEGSRVLGVAYKEIDQNRIKATDESDMILAGLLIFRDPPKADIEKTIKDIHDLGVSLKIITGDNHLVAHAVAELVGFKNPVVMPSSEMHSLSSAALVARVNSVDVFAEIEPNQKEAIILALKKAGNVVGYIGDGINDASALHAADIGISVNNAVDVAKEAAQLVMLDHDLAVLVQGIKVGRQTFANTLKYIFMATSANFGNMFSMAGASLFLPFLPLLPKQILLNNLMTDFPEMALVTDSVDEEMIRNPGRWDMKFIRQFMLVFGTISSTFDFITFASLILIFKSSAEQFRTAWFTESVVSACLIVLVVRTQKPFMLSRPGKILVIANIAVSLAAIGIPYTPLAPLLGFEPLPISIIAVLLVIVAAYVVTAEISKKFFYRKFKLQ